MVQEGGLIRIEGGVSNIEDAYDPPFVFLLPPLTIFAITLFALRILPLILGVIAWLIQLTNSVGLLIVTRQLQRSPGTYNLPLILLVSTISLGIYTASFARTIDRHLYEQQFYQVGADISVRVFNTINTFGSSSEEEDTAFIPISEYNNIEGIENNVLSRIGKQISIYYIESLEECHARIDDIIAFLEREDSKLLITGVNFIHNTPALRCYLPKNAHKILILEQFVKGSDAICNSLGSMLNVFFNIVYFNKKIKPLFLFGMDGLPSPNTSNQDSHAFMETYQNKLPRNNVQIQHFGKLKNHKQTIYEDMICFDEKTIPYFKEVNKSVFLKKAFKMYNASEDSFYKSLPKISQKKAIDLIQENINVDCKQMQYYKPDLNELFDIYNKIIDFVNRHFALERLYIENSIFNIGIYLIFRVLALLTKKWVFFETRLKKFLVNQIILIFLFDSHAQFVTFMFSQQAKMMAS